MLFKMLIFTFFLTMIPKGYQTPHIMIKKIKKKKILPILLDAMPSGQDVPKTRSPRLASQTYSNVGLEPLCETMAQSMNVVIISAVLQQGVGFTTLIVML